MIAPADLAACRAQLACGSRTFLAASRFLPASVRDAACALYAFCRLADDAIDQQHGDAARIRAALESLRERIDAMYAGRPFDCAADRALADVVVRYRIARALPDALIDGFAWDAAHRRYETLDELEGYAARVAGSVGAMMAVLMGVRTREGLARATDLGVAMQLSNIARDVGEDARMGRVYLPLAWLRDAGIDPDTFVARPVHSDALGTVVRRLLDAADVLYERVGAGVAQLPFACRPGINAARRLYAEIGHEVARRGLDAVTQRAVVAPRRKVRVAVSAVAGAMFPLHRCADGPLVATRYLVDAACDDTPRTNQAMPPAWNLAARAVWTIELLERLERQRRIELPAPSARWPVGLSR